MGADTGKYKAHTPVNEHLMVDSTHANASAARYKRVVPLSSKPVEAHEAQWVATSWQ